MKTHPPGAYKYPVTSPMFQTQQETTMHSHTIRIQIGNRVLFDGEILDDNADRLRDRLTGLFSTLSLCIQTRGVERGSESFGRLIEKDMAENPDRWRRAHT